MPKYKFYILFLYGKIQVKENPYSGIFYAINDFVRLTPIFP